LKIQAAMMYNPEEAKLEVNGQTFQSALIYYKGDKGFASAGPVNINEYANHTGSSDYYIGFPSPPLEIGDHYALRLGNILLNGVAVPLPVRRDCYIPATPGHLELDTEF
jgi:hypothetical protein